MNRKFWIVSGVLPLTALAVACDAPRPTEPTGANEALLRGSLDPTLASEVRQLAEVRGIGPLPRTPLIRRPLARLGQALAFDRILSGNRDISCTAMTRVFEFGSNAIAAFFLDQLTFANSPWDRFLAGDDDALSPNQLEGVHTSLAMQAIVTASAALRCAASN